MIVTLFVWAFLLVETSVGYNGCSRPDVVGCEVEPMACTSSVTHTQTYTHDRVLFGEIRAVTTVAERRQPLGLTHGWSFSPPQIHLARNPSTKAGAMR